MNVNVFLEAQASQVSQEMALHSQLRLIVTRLQEFAARVKDGLDLVDWATQRELICTLVKQVEVEQGQVNVVFRVGPNPSTPEPGKDFLQHCKGRDNAALGSACLGGMKGGIFHISCCEPLGN